VVTNQHLPRLLRPAHAALDQLAACLDANLRASSAHRTAIAMAEWPYGTADWLDPTGMS